MDGLYESFLPCFDDKLVHNTYRLIGWEFFEKGKAFLAPYSVGNTALYSNKCIVTYIVIV